MSKNMKITITMPLDLACSVENALDMAISGYTITDAEHKRRIAEAMDIITDSILFDGEG